MFRSRARPGCFAAREILSLCFPLVAARLELEQRSSKIREFPGIEHLGTRVAFPVERGHARCTGIRSIRRRIEPQAKVIGMDSSVQRTKRNIRKRVGEDDWGRGRNVPRRDDERLDIESADESAVSHTVSVSLDIPLVPGETKWLVWHLDDKKVKVGVGRKNPRR
jgi:hypothetical protein